MGRDRNVLKGRLAERMAQGVRDYLAAMMGGPIADMGQDPLEHVKVEYLAETAGDETTVTVTITGNPYTPFQQVHVGFRFKH